MNKLPITPDLSVVQIFPTIDFSSFPVLQGLAASIFLLHLSYAYKIHVDDARHENRQTEFWIILKFTWIGCYR
jgi:hypothetical protein